VQFFQPGRLKRRRKKEGAKGKKGFFFLEKMGPSWYIRRGKERL
jgi:hypothetical protein